MTRKIEQLLKLEQLLFEVFNGKYCGVNRKLAVGKIVVFHI